MEIMEYLCRAEQRGRMMAATTTPCIPFKNECPIEGHPFLPNNKGGLLLSHQTKVSSQTAGNRRIRKPLQYGKEKGVNLFS